MGPLDMAAYCQMLLVVVELNAPLPSGQDTEASVSRTQIGKPTDVNGRQAMVNFGLVSGISLPWISVAPYQPLVTDSEGSMVSATLID